MLPHKTHRADLENKKVIFAEVGLILTLLLVYLLFNMKFQSAGKADYDFEAITSIAEEIVPITIQQAKPVLQEPPAQTVKITIVENDVEVESDIEINAAASQETVIEAYVPPVFTEIEEETAIEEQPIFIVVESMPEFPGGMEMMMKYLRENLKYPHLAKETNIQGRVFISFVVEVDGCISDVTVLRGIGGGCDEEAVRVVQNMPKWNPGKQRGIPVRVRFNLPVKFTLQ
jgi:protein TonB